MSDSSESAKSFGSTRSRQKASRAKCVSIDEPSDICRVAVRIPPFWPDDPEVWFAQVEAQFVNGNITSDATKFHYVIGNLEHQYSKQIRDIILNPPEHNKYDKLKNELIKRLSASHEKKVKQLLVHEELGDRKPSQFLRHLQSLAGPSVPEDFLRTIWSSRLPSNIQTLLASQPQTSLEGLADLADRVQDIVTPGQIAAASASGLSMQEMANEIAELKRTIKDLTLQLRDSRSRNRSHSRGRDARRHSRNRSKTRSDSNYRQHPVCWYHAMHGVKAMRCIKPCDFRQENAAGNQ